MIVVYIILALLAFAAIGFVAMVVAAFVKQTYQLATGKITRAQLDEMAKAAKPLKPRKKRRFLASGHSWDYPAEIRSALGWF